MSCNSKNYNVSQLKKSVTAFVLECLKIDKKDYDEKLNEVKAKLPNIKDVNYTMRDPEPIKGNDNATVFTLIKKEV